MNEKNVFSFIRACGIGSIVIQFFRYEGRLDGPQPLRDVQRPWMAMAIIRPFRLTPTRGGEVHS